MKEIESNNQITIAIGLGKSCIAASKYLSSNGEKVLIFENSSNESLKKIAAELINLGINVQLGTPLEFSSFKPWIATLSSVVIGPGIPWNHDTLNKLRVEGIEIKSEISIAWESLKGIPWVGVTGTNGKTTVTNMLHHVLQNSPIDSYIGGNIGRAATELSLAFKDSSTIKNKWLIIELSSYQIESAPEIAPQIGIWTTLTPDHLERHGSINNYFKIKRSLLKKSSLRIYNADDKYLNAHRNQLPKGIWVSIKGPGSKADTNKFWITSKGQVIEEGTELFNAKVLSIPGAHNLQNLLLVTAAAREIGLSAKSIENAIKSFKSIEHRLEKLSNISGIEIFNDSKATNFDSAEIALKATKGPLILIAGGLLKKGEASQWIKQIKSKALAVVLFGKSREIIKLMIKENGFKGEIHCYERLEKSVMKSINLGITLKVKSILFSPACSSFDLYNNFEERGEDFKSIVKLFRV